MIVVAIRLGAGLRNGKRAGARRHDLIPPYGKNDSTLSAGAVGMNATKQRERAVRRGESRGKR